MSTNDMLTAVIALFSAYLEAFKTEIKSHWSWQAGQHLGTQIANGEADRGQVNTVITVVTLGLVAIIGILIFDEVDTSVGDPSNTALSNSQSNVTDGFGDAMDLVPVVLLVLVASLVIAVVQQF
jgi:hypothetical protein